jgi:hypothetical protein
LIAYRMNRDPVIKGCLYGGMGCSVMCWAVVRNASIAHHHQSVGMQRNGYFM